MTKPQLYACPKSRRPLPAVVSLADVPDSPGDVDEFDYTAPVLALVIEPGAERAALRPIAANQPRVLRQVIGGWLEGVNMGDETTIMYLDEEGKLKGRSTNLLATKIVHRLAGGAGLLPDDTISGTAVLVGRLRLGGEHGEVCGDMPAETAAALSDLGIIYEI